MLCDGLRPVGRLHRRNCENVTLSADLTYISLTAKAELTSKRWYLT
jgi:hypothetical protein